MKGTLTNKATKGTLQHIFDRVKKSTFLRNILIVMTGTAVGQIIGFALTPIISRLFSPSDFGIFGAFNSISNIFAAGATLQYSHAIMIPKEKDAALNLFFISCLSTFAVSFFCLILCLLVPAHLNGFMKTSGVWILLLLVVATTVAGLNESFQFWCIRTKAFNRTSASQVIRSVASNSMQIGTGYFRVGAAGLIVSSIFADIFASINLARMVLPDIYALRHRVSWVRIKQLSKEYRDFPLYAASQNVVWALSVGLPVLLLTHFYGIVVGGAYTFGVRMIQTPMGVLLGALRQVLYQKASEVQHQDGNLTPLYTKTTAGLFAVCLMPSLILFIWAPQIFVWVFGPQWLTAGEFARWLVLWLTFYFCELPAVLFARLLRIQRMVFVYDLVLLAVRVSVLVLGGMYLSARQSIVIFSVVGAVMNLLLILMVGYVVKKRKSATM